MYEDDNDYAARPHFACPGGCGQLQDECACRRISRPAPKPEPAYEDWDDAPMGCRRTRCTQDAVTGGYCDDHSDV